MTKRQKEVRAPFDGALIASIVKPASDMPLSCLRLTDRRVGFFSFIGSARVDELDEAIARANALPVAFPGSSVHARPRDRDARLPTRRSPASSRQGGPLVRPAPPHGDAAAPVPIAAPVVDMSSKLRAMRD